MIVCEACCRYQHLKCIGLQEVPQEDRWLCRECCEFDRRLRVRAAQARASRASASQPATFDASRPARRIKDERRAKAGLGKNTVPTLEDLGRFLQAGKSDATRKKEAAVEQGLNRLLQELGPGYRRDSPHLLGLYVLWRVNQRISERTILSEMGVLQKLPGLQTPDDDELKEIKKAVKRMAEQPGCAKEPLLLVELTQLRTYLLRDWKDDDSPRERKKMRDWAFFYLGFVGMFRSKELLDLQWDSVTIGWQVAGKLIELPAGEVPAAVRTAEKVSSYATLLIAESKTDVEARGQKVRILAAGTGTKLEDCPVQLLLWLKKRARGTSVFEELRKDYPPTPITYETMLHIFKRSLAGAGLPKDRVDSLALHSLRRGGATTAFAQGASIREIMVQGRWRSDTVNIYALVSDQQAGGLTGKLVASLRS